MSYRNDHEAALARIAALEQEVARLRTATATPAALWAPTTSESPPATPWPLEPSVYRAVVIGAVLGLAFIALAAS